MSDPIDLNILQLRVFIVLGEELHFGRTADRLVLTQPYVSRTLAALERRIGGRLCERTSRKVRLTPLGESFHAELKEAYASLARAFERAQSTASVLSGEIVVGCTATTAGHPLTSLVRAFEKTHPEYQVRLREVAQNHPYDALHAGIVDVLVCWLPEEAPGLAWGPVIDEQPLVLLMRAGHPLAGRESVSIEVAADFGLPNVDDVSLPKSVEDALSPQETPSGRRIPRVGPQCRTIGEVAGALARYDAVKPTVTSVARGVAHREDLTYVPIPDAPPVRLGPIWLADRSGEPIRAFVDVAEQESRRRSLRGDDIPAATVSRRRPAPAANV